MGYSERHIQPFVPTGHVPGQWPPVSRLRRWQQAWKSIVLIWVAALGASWLIGLGAVRCIILLEKILRRL
jgi:hypothetical protein